VLVLEDVNLSIKAGSKMAIVGGSGSGKSTMLKLLLGLYEPTKGEIAINNKATTTYTKADLRNIFAYVPQDSFLFPESIGKNITLENEIADMARLEKACAEAGILDFINSLPDGLNSILTEGADNISGGQRQRIAMARAFYKNAPVILFDEATSSLDPATEAAILSSFANVAAGKTVIMVAHRPMAIAACDVIIVMENGKVAGVGSHDELLKNNEAYQNLYESKQYVTEGKVAQ
jgi:ABC-type multidrug transport system fused ATPase/permease subunit